jgi:two-component system sensor histidine kinase MtrB
VVAPPTADRDRPSAARVAAAAAAIARVVGRRMAATLAAARRAWRQSLQLRVVAITLIASGLLVGVFGYLVVELSTRNLLTRAQQAALEQLQTDAEYARGQLSSFSTPNDRELLSTMHQLVSSRAEGDRLLILIAPSGAADPVATRNAPVPRALSPELLAEVRDGNRAWQILTAELDDSMGPVTYLAYGQPVPASWSGPSFQLYSLTPLTTEVNSANDIRRTVLATGGALVLLLATVTALVTRMVVRPVRMAARTARRLSAGLLDQRMTVTGEDDLALLGASFNQMAENLQRQIVRLEEMSRLQRRFTSDVSHELRTPLTTIRMAADLIFSERDSYPPEVARSAELLQHELDRFESLLTDLLEISRFDAGFAALDGEATDLGPVVRQAVDALGPLCARTGSRLRLHLPAEPVIAEVDRRRVDRILRNLIGNAAEHGEGRPIDVTLAGGDAAVAVTVRDYGVGLRPGHEKQVFNRFWRADPSRARQTGGTGLGLSISLEDARLHGGWLEAWGAPGRGAVFRLTLPVRVGDRLRTSPLPLVPADAEEETLTRVGP